MGGWWGGRETLLGRRWEEGQQGGEAPGGRSGVEKGGAGIRKGELRQPEAAGREQAQWVVGWRQQGTSYLPPTT